MTPHTEPSAGDFRTRQRGFLRILNLLCVPLMMGGCVAGPGNHTGSTSRAKQIIISVRDQKMTVIRDDGRRTTFPVSTSKFGLGDHRNHYETPTGNLEIAQKIGAGAPVGAVFKSRVRTGEIVAINAPGRDAIVTRVLALRGLETGNRDALQRGIYIHGTPEERRIGEPASYGCIRMRSKDVIQLYDLVSVGAKVIILEASQGESEASRLNLSKPL